MKIKVETTFERFEREYIQFSNIVLQILEKLDDENLYREKWRKAYFDPECLTEWSLDYDSYCEAFLSDLRKGRPTNLNCLQIKEILRLNHMINHYDLILNSQELPQDLEAMRTLMTEHPRWKRISRQANKILGLLRRKDSSSETAQLNQS